MTMHRPVLVSMMFAVVSVSCRDAPLAENISSNIAPIANAGEQQVVAYDGSPVTVTLDGSQSSDADGTVASYRWLSANRGDGGIGRGGPDPDDIEKPTLSLAQGVWVFTLFVVDDAGGTSLPATVTITVGDVVAPEVTECVDDALAAIAADCRACVCGQSDMCRTALAACDQACWDFYSCVQTQCADVGEDEAALTSCVRSSCSDFFAGAVAYMAVEPCLSAETCAEVCATSARM